MNPVAASAIVAPRMQSLQGLEKALKRLDISWKVIETTARVISPPESAGFVSTLEHTRLAFSQLAGEMVEKIAQTHLQNCRNDLASRAQVAIDILVRNLFERTADVGFIATDAPLADFVLQPEASHAAALHARLTEYRNKYTVYDDILVLDASAQILLSLQPREAQTAVLPGWWERMLANRGYVEVYGASALFNRAGKVLLYAHCIVAPSGAVCGAVVLKFDLQSELASIFKALQHPSAVLHILDAQGQVVARSDATGAHSASPVRLPGADRDGPPILCHQGEDYLYAHCRTRGYQGYAGPGWTALALTPLDCAFPAGTLAGASDATEPIATAPDIELDNAQLRDIIARAKAIEEDLNRVIWNGKLRESGVGSGSALSPVFAEIGRTSFQTIAAFDGAIAELKKLLIVGTRAELAAHAALAVDIMDRNLYERANDCRWWALSGEFADLLAALEAGPSDAAVQRASAILAHLNSLYTVYRRVALFDRQGRILAVSRDPHSMAPDAAIPSDLLQHTLVLQGTQAYAVSGMQAHALADGRPTYLYCAAVRRSGQEPVLGGIALAFDCSSELKAMLQDSLPVGSSACGVFLDPTGRVLASTDEAIGVGDRPEFLAHLPQAGVHGADAPLCAWNGQTYLLGLAESKGYREFKVSDGYHEDVRSVLLTLVRPSPAGRKPQVLPFTTHPSEMPSRYFGIVQSGRMLFALDSAHVIEAVSSANLSAPPAASRLAGMMQYACNGQIVVLPVMDSRSLTGQAPRKAGEKSVAIVLQAEHLQIVLLVDRLLDVVGCDALQSPPGGISADAPWICGLIHDNQIHTEPLFALDPTGLSLAF